VKIFITSQIFRAGRDIEVDENEFGDKEAVNGVKIAAATNSSIENLILRERTVSDTMRS